MILSVSLSVNLPVILPVPVSLFMGPARLTCLGISSAVLPSFLPCLLPCFVV
jgi:hypothetical protein